MKNARHAMSLVYTLMFTTTLAIVLPVLSVLISNKYLYTCEFDTSGSCDLGQGFGGILFMMVTIPLMIILFPIFYGFLETKNISFIPRILILIVNGLVVLLFLKNFF